MLSGVKLQMMRGDIINGGTDVIVNTTDFSSNPTGMFYIFICISNYFQATEAFSSFIFLTQYTTLDLILTVHL